MPGTVLGAAVSRVSRQALPWGTLSLVAIKFQLSLAQKHRDMGVVVVVSGGVTLEDQKRLFRGIDYSAAA